MYISHSFYYTHEFFSDTKPWIQDVPSHLKEVKSIDDVQSSTEYWYYILRQLNHDKLQIMNLNFDQNNNLNLKHNSLGHKMTIKIMIEAISS